MRWSAEFEAFLFFCRFWSPADNDFNLAEDRRPILNLFVFRFSSLTRAECPFASEISVSQQASAALPSLMPPLNQLRPNPIQAFAPPPTMDGQQLLRERRR